MADATTSAAWLASIWQVFTSSSDFREDFLNFTTDPPALHLGTPAIRLGRSNPVRRWISATVSRNPLWSAATDGSHHDGNTVSFRYFGFRPSRDNASPRAFHEEEAGRRDLGGAKAGLRAGFLVARAMDF